MGRRSRAGLAGLVLAAVLAWPLAGEAQRSRTPAPRPDPPEGYAYEGADFSCSGRIAISPIRPVGEAQRAATNAGFRADTYLSYRTRIVSGLQGFSADQPGFGRALLAQLNDVGERMEVNLRVRPRGGGPEVAQYAPVVNAARTTGAPADPQVTPEFTAFGPAVIRLRNDMVFEVMHRYGQTLDTQIPGLLIRLAQGAAAIGALQVPPVAAALLTGIRPEDRRDADEFFNRAFSYNVNAEGRSGCPIELSSEMVERGVGLFVRILDRDAATRNAAVLLAFTITPETRQSLLRAEVAATGDLRYAANWNADSFLMPFGLGARDQRPLDLLRAASTDIATRLQSRDFFDNVMGCLALWTEQPFLGAGFNPPDAAALNWAALMNRGSRVVAVTRANAIPSQCPTDFQQPNRYRVTDLVPIPLIGVLVSDAGQERRDRTATRQANLTQFMAAFRARGAFNPAGAAMSSPVWIATGDGTQPLGDLPRPEEGPQPVGHDVLAAAFQPFASRSVRPMARIDGDVVRVLFRLDTQTTEGFVHFGGTNAIVGLTFGTPAMNIEAVAGVEVASGP